MLAEEKDKNAKLSQHLINANKNNVQLRRRADKVDERGKGETTAKEDYEIKISKYRDMVRKKDELLTKHQQKI